MKGQIQLIVCAARQFQSRYQQRWMIGIAAIQTLFCERKKGTVNGRNLFRHQGVAGRRGFLEPGTARGNEMLQQGIARDQQ